jgi:peptidylprolyl isomerase
MHWTLAVLLVVGAAACRTQSAATSPLPQQPSSIAAVAGDTQMVSGVRYIDVLVGSGAPVERRKCVYVHYTGWLSNGKKFDSSRDTTPEGKPGGPIAFALGVRQVITGWDIGIEGMKVGGKRRLFVPYQLGYGTRGSPPVIPPRSDLLFDVEVLHVGEARLSRPSAPTSLSCPRAE